jgi:hypothetical protein
MTGLTKPVRRESQAHHYERGHNRPVIVILEPPDQIAFRLKGTKRVFRLPIGRCFMLAAQAYAQAEKARRAQDRKNRRLTR